MKIPVVWFEGIAGLDKYSAQFASEGIQGRSRYACCGLLNDAFDSYGDLFTHYSGWDGMPKIPEYAVLIIHGGHLRYQTDLINEKAQQLQGVLFIIIGDEEADFDESKLWTRNFLVWRQSPIPGKSNASRYPVVGYPVDCRELLVHGQERIYDFSFCGQVTHIRREQCVEAARNIRNGYLHTTKQFYSGLEHAEYFKILGQSKIVLCPSGPVNADTFRMAEALEAGAIPVCDEFPGWRDQPTTGIFNMLFQQGYPFPVVKNWSELPSVMESILNNYDEVQRTVSFWWAAYKAEYYSWLRTDLKSLGVNL